MNNNSTYRKNNRVSNRSSSQLYMCKWKIGLLFITIMLVSSTSNCLLERNTQEVIIKPPQETPILSIETPPPSTAPPPTNNLPVPTQTWVLSATTKSTVVPTKSLTPTITWTLAPLVTLSQEDVLRELDYLNQSEDCRLPCWHGLTPGVSSRDEVPSFIRSFGIDTSGKEPLLDDGYYWLGGAIQNYPNIFSNIRMSVWVGWKDDIVEVIEITGLDPKYAFDVVRLAEVLMIPDRILVFGGLAAPHTFGLVLDFPRDNLLIDVSGTSRGRPGDIQFTEELCLWDEPYNYVDLYLYSDESESQVMTRYNEHPWYDWAEILEITTEELFSRLQSSDECIPTP